MTNELATVRLDRLEEMLLEIERRGEQVSDGDIYLMPHQFETTHAFPTDLYARTLRLPANSIFIGGKHKSHHVLVVSGDLSVVMDGVVRRLTGYHVIESGPSARRAGFAHAETFMTTVHANPTNERDVAALETLLIENAPMLQSRRQPEEIEAWPS
jgi:hypothetical protein